MEHEQHYDHCHGHCDKHTHHCHDITHKCAHECDDQLANIQHVGRGIRGNSMRIEITDDEIGEDLTYLTAYEYDEITKTSQEVWRSDNINGGRLQLFYKLNPYDSPRSFCMTFIYTRPEVGKDGEHKRSTWHWTSPAIPYLYTVDPMIGSDVASIFLKDHTTSSTDMWKEVTVFPPHTEREDFNTPNPPGGASKLTKTAPKYKGDEWTVSLDIVEFDEFVKITGISASTLISIIKGVTSVIKPNFEGRSDYFKTDFKDVTSDNIKDYIEDMTGAENTARHKADEDIWNAINNFNNSIKKLSDDIDGKINKINKTLQDIVNHIYPGYNNKNVINADGSITWGVKGTTDNPAMIPVGNINVYGVDEMINGLYTHPIEPRKKGDIYGR